MWSSAVSSERSMNCSPSVAPVVSLFVFTYIISLLSQDSLFLFELRVHTEHVWWGSFMWADFQTQKSSKFWMADTQSVPIKRKWSGNSLEVFLYSFYFLFSQNVTACKAFLFFHLLETHSDWYFSLHCWNKNCFSVALPQVITEHNLRF